MIQHRYKCDACGKEGDWHPAGCDQDPAFSLAAASIQMRSRLGDQINLCDECAGPLLALAPKASG